MRYVVGSVRLVGLFFLTIFIFFVAIGILPVLQVRSRAKVIKTLAPVIPWVLGMKVLVKGQIPNAAAARGLREDGPGYLVSANHISFMDIFLMDSILPVRFIAKKEIGYSDFLYSRYATCEQEHTNEDYCYDGDTCCCQEYDLHNVFTVFSHFLVPVSLLILRQPSW